jgi:FtsK/SpoIIIE family
MTATLTTPAAVPVFPFSIFDPVHLGVDEYGDQVHVNLAERNLLIGGEPGGGKSSALNLITAHGALSCDCRLVLVDGNQVQLGPWRHSADMFIGPSLKDAIAAFTEFQQIMNRRYARLLADGRRKITRDSGEDVYLVVIDEYAYYSATVGKKTEREEFAALARDLIARGRAAGSSSSWPPSGHRTRSSTRPCGTCSPTGWHSAAPPTPPRMWCSAWAGPEWATPPPASTPSPAAWPGCCPKPASPAGSRPPSSPTRTSTTWPPARPSSAGRTLPMTDHRPSPGGKNTVKPRLTPNRRTRPVENDEYAAFARRVLRAYGRRIASGDIDAITELSELAEEVESALGRSVLGLRLLGYSWTEIGHRLGVTRQAAHQRWGGTRP